MPAYLVYLKIVFAYAAIAGVNAALANLGLLTLPFWAIPLVSAALNALAEWLRSLLPASRVGGGAIASVIKAIF